MKHPMKLKLFFLTVSCLLLLVATGLAQQPVPQNFAEIRQSPAMQQAMKSGMKTSIRAFWDGRGANLMAFALITDPDIRAAWGVSDEDYQEMQGLPMRIGTEMRNHPEHQKMMEEMQALGGPGALFGQNVDEETQRKFQDVQERMITLTMDIMSEAIGDAVTPDQRQKMNETLLANMSEMPIASPGMYEALGLSDFQREQMEAIKKELEPEFMKNLDDFVNDSMLIANMMFEELEKQGFDNFQNMMGEPGRDPQAMQEQMREMQERMQGVQKKLMENPEYKRISDGLQARGTAFASQFNTKMFDVLTDAQWARLQDLIDNPPEYAKVFAKKLKEQRGEQEQAGGAWTPGPNSWRPGDAIPEGYRTERNTRSRFPRGEE